MPGWTILRQGEDSFFKGGEGVAEQLVCHLETSPTLWASLSTGLCPHGRTRGIRAEVPTPPWLGVLRESEPCRNTFPASSAYHTSVSLVLRVCICEPWHPQQLQVSAQWQMKMKRLLHLCVSPNSHPPAPHLYISQKQIRTFTGCSNEFLVFIYIKEENSNQAFMSSTSMSLGIFYLLLLLYGPRCQEQNQSVKILEQPTGCQDTALTGTVQEWAGTLIRVMSQMTLKERVARFSQLRTQWSVGFPYLARPCSRGYNPGQAHLLLFRLPCLLEKRLFYNAVLKNGT